MTNCRCQGIACETEDGEHVEARDPAWLRSNAPSNTSATRRRRCEGRRRDLPRCRWAAAGPGRASRRRAERSSQRGRLAGGPPPTGTHSGRTLRRPEHQRGHKQRVIGHFVLLGLVPGVVVGGGVVEFVEADCVAPAGDGAGGLVGLTGLVPGVFEGCVGGHGRQDCCCWLRVG